MHTPPVSTRERPCPHCGYDLRGTPSPRCPECGTEITEPIRRGHSRLPWVRGPHAGRVSGYLRTVWLLVMRPRELAKDAAGPIYSKRANRFARISLILATLIGVISLAAIFGAKQGILEPQSGSPVVLLPISALTASWLGLLPLALALSLSCWLNLSTFREIVTLGTERGVARGRLWRSTQFLSGILPLVMVWIALALLAFAVLERPDLYGISTELKERAQGILSLAGVIFIVLSWALVIRAGISLILQHSRWKKFRSVLVIAFFPCAIILTYVVTLLLFWFAGYVAMAAMSMTR